jgi:hypothetical protein
MRKLAAAFAATSLLLLAACGDDGKKEADSSSGTTAAGATTSVAGGGDSGGSGEGSDLAALVAKRERARVRVTYEASGTGTGTETTLTLAQDGKGGFSYRLANTLFIVKDGTVVSCTGIDGEPTCLDMGDAGGAAARSATSWFAVADDALDDVEDTAFTDVSTQTIAGREARCAKVEHGGASWEMCADKETGILLRWAGSGGGQSTSFTATEFAEADESDFTPPATPQKLPTIPGVNG